MYLHDDTDDEFLEPDDKTIEQVIRRVLLDPGESFAVLESDRDSFIQTSPVDASTLYVEYRSDGQNYVMQNVPVETVIALFQSYNLNGTSWKNDHPWIDKPTDNGPSISETLGQVEERTGRSLDKWLTLIKQSGLAGRALRTWLKKEHSLPADLSSLIRLIAEVQMGLSQNQNDGKSSPDGEPEGPGKKTNRLLQQLTANLDRYWAAMREGDVRNIEQYRREVENDRTALAELKQLGRVPDTLPEPHAKLLDQFAGWMDASECITERAVVTSSTLAKGVVYLLKAGPYYKIGKSINFEQRLNQISLQLPYTVEEVHQILTDDPSGIESYWHKRFSPKRTNGEWFS
jgi:Meiotically up-regulated gene 113/Domain of unknown function (DUF4287)